MIFLHYLVQLLQDLLESRRVIVIVQGSRLYGNCMGATNLRRYYQFPNKMKEIRPEGELAHAPPRLCLTTE